MLYPYLLGGSIEKSFQEQKEEWRRRDAWVLSRNAEEENQLDFVINATCALFPLFSPSFLFSLHLLPKWGIIRAVIGFILSNVRGFPPPPPSEMWGKSKTPRKKSQLSGGCKLFCLVCCWEKSSSVTTVLVPLFVKDLLYHLFLNYFKLRFQNWEVYSEI